MKLLIKKAKIIDSSSSLNEKIVDVLVENGKITAIDKNISDDQAKEVSFKNLHLSRGWVDLHTNLQDPGYEHKEDFESGRKAAAAGGFTRIGLSPLSLPVRDSKSQIEYVINQNKSTLVELLPYGTVSKNAEGKELAELYDMHQAGAKAFFDGKNSISNPNLLIRALDYCRSFDGLLMNFTYNKDISPEGVMNEGEVSTSLGLKGIPELAEEIMLNRDIYLSNYTKGRLHFSTISSAASVQLIAEAKKKGLNISCDVSSAHLLISDLELESFDSRLKTLPPFRSKSTVKSLIQGIKKGTIDALCSDHWPQDIESKKKEFDHADFGIINLQTAFAAANTALQNEVSINKIIDLFTEGPEKILKIDKNEIKVGAKANFTLFNPDQNFVFEKKDVLSKSLNSPFFGKQLKGVVYGVVNNGKSNLN